VSRLEAALLHFNVTEYPTAEWTRQQIVEAFVDRDAPRYLIRDRDGVYGAAFRNRVESLKIEQVLTADGLGRNYTLPLKEGSSNSGVWL
jgi:hypothetical protein